MTSAEKDALILATTHRAMLRAADIIDRITDADVTRARDTMLHRGAKIEDVAKIDRARLASAYLRECAKGRKAVQVVREGVAG